MRSVLPLVAVLVLGGWAVLRHLPLGSAEAEPARTSQPQDIQSISIDGRGLPTASLRALLTTQPGEAVDTAKLARDRAALQAELEARGYLAANVHEAEITYDGGAFVTFAIEQGSLFRVRDVRVTGATVKDAGVVTIGAGEIATADRLRLAREALAERLTVRGKSTTVEASIHPDLAAALVDIELAVH